MLAVLEKAYRQNPEAFKVIDYLRSSGWEFEDKADERVLAIWMQHVEKIDL
jgi:hypothetical protein